MAENKFGAFCNAHLILVIQRLEVWYDTKENYAKKNNSKAASLI